MRRRAKPYTNVVNCAVAKAITGSHCNGFHFFRNTLNHNKETA